MAMAKKKAMKAVKEKAMSKDRPMSPMEAKKMKAAPKSPKSKMKGYM